MIDSRDYWWWQEFRTITHDLVGGKSGACEPVTPHGAPFWQCGVMFWMVVPQDLARHAGRGKATAGTSIPRPSCEFMLCRLWICPSTSVCSASLVWLNLPKHTHSHTHLSTELMTLIRLIRHLAACELPHSYNTFFSNHLATLLLLKHHVALSSVTNHSFLQQLAFLQQ